MFLFYTVFQRVTKIKSFYSSNDLNELICRFLKVQRQNGVLNAKRTFIFRLFKIFQAKKRFDSKRVGWKNRLFRKGCKTVGITSNAGTLIDKTADISIVTDTGAEVVTGSTRMKAGTAQKIVLNMISTCAMIKTGKVYENLMINLRPTNNKFKKRIIGIVREICGCDESEALERLQKNNWVIRDAVKQSWKGC